MALTVQNGALVVRDGKLGTGQGCCCGYSACGTRCSQEEYDTLSDLFITITFSGFVYAGRLGFNNFDCSQSCNDRYGTGGTGITQSAFYQPFIDFANNFQATLVFRADLATSEFPFVWEGSGTGDAPAPDNGTLTTYYSAYYRCSTSRFELASTLFDDDFTSCSTGELRLEGPTLGNSFIPGQNSYKCGTRGITREVYTGLADFLVACGSITDGCRTATTSCEENYFRIRLSGNYTATVESNVLP